VRVQVSRVDLDGRKIDFRLVREGEGEPLLAKGERTERPRPASASADLSAVQDADRVAKAATRAFKAGGKGGAAGKAAADAARRPRKPGPQRPAPKPRKR
jgi:ribonuclease R